MKRPPIILACIASLFAFSPLPLVLAQTNDSIVSWEADVAGLPLIAPADLPNSGTFWLISGNNSLPFPCPPLGIGDSDSYGNNIYQLPNGAFLIDGTANGDGLMSGAQLVKQMNAVSNIIQQAETAVTSRTMRMRAMDDSGVPSLGGSGDGGTNDYSPDDVTSTPPDYGSNLYLAQISLASGYLTGIASNTMADVPYEVMTRPSLNPTEQWTATGLFIYGSETTNWTTLNPLAIGLTNNLFIRLRSAIDSENVGIPDWWQLKYFGYVGINPYAESPSGDGFTIFQKYQSGLDPTGFETPPAPGNFVAVVSTNGTNALLSWNPAQGAVTNYSIFRYTYDYDTGDDGNATIGTADASATSFVDSGPIDNSSGEFYYYYSLVANYPGGNTSATADSYLYDIAPTPPTPPAPVYNISVAATLVRNGAGRWQLMFSGLPANAQTINLIWTGGNNMTQNISTNALTNGVYQIPDTDAVNFLGDTISVQGIGANGEAGQVAPAGTLSADAPYFVDGRQHLKQNLNFLIRAAALNQPFGGTYRDYDDNNQFNSSGYNGRLNQSATNFEEFSFIHHNTALDDLWPFAANYYLANFLVDVSRTNADQYPIGNTNFDFTPDFATNIPAPPILANASPYWILQPGFNPGGIANSAAAAANWGVTLLNYTNILGGYYLTASLGGGLVNLFGLPYQTGCEADLLPGEVDPRNGSRIWFPLYQPLAPGDSVTVEQPEADYGIGSYASGCPAPTLLFTNYYFAPLINPNDNPLGLPPLSQQPVPLPIDDTFNVTNQTPPVIIGSVGQPMIIGGWAKYAIQGSANKFAYLGQYFETNAFLLDTNGNVTTNSAGILSPYGEFFPTQGGQAQLITMPDIDTGIQGTSVVQIVSLNVDANHDGTMDLSYFGQDQTSPSQPYVFWCNNNFDRWDDDPPFGTMEQDDLESAGCAYTPGTPTPDGNYLHGDGTRVIPCTRDLEDFSRLWISGVTTNLLANLPAGSTITLNWGDVGNANSANPTIDLFQAADVDGGIGYLTNETTAGLQVDSDYNPYIGRVAPGGSLQLNAATFANSWAGNHFIWCGVANGTGKLTLTFASANGMVLGQAAVYIQIVDIKQMYERWTVGDVSTQPPATTAYLAQDNLPAGQAAFQYANPATAGTPYILHVHGYNMPTWAKARFAETEYKRLYWQGYQGRFGAFDWPTATSAAQFGGSESQAWLSAQGLLNKLEDLNSQYPGQVYLTVHSLGNVVAGEALRLATNQVVNTYIAMQGAVSAHAYDPTTPEYTIPTIDDSGTPDCYANYWTNGAPCYFNASAGAGTYVNFFNGGDWALSDAWLEFQNLKPSLSGYGFSNTSGTNAYFTIVGGEYKTYFTFPSDTYELFANLIQSRSYALGEEYGVGGVFKAGGTYNQVQLDAAPYNFGTEHIYHSGEFRSDTPQMWQFWSQVLFRMGLKKQP